MAAILAGPAWGTLLAIYFGCSVALTKFRSAEKEKALAGIVSKAGARDAYQVICNGGVFTCAAVAHTVWPSHSIALLGAASLAASAADTFATEIGTLATAPPRSIVTLTRIGTGESGGVTVLGFVAALAGSALIATAATALGWPTAAWWPLFGAGIVGSTADSVLGGLLQRKQWCEVCSTFTERRIHLCGAASVHRSGLRWIDNDAVNLISTLTGAIAAIGLAAIA